MRPGGAFDPMAPVNVSETGRILRKTRFDLPREGPRTPSRVRHRAVLRAEWMWVEVASLDDRFGILMSEPAFVRGLELGALVAFRVLPRTHPVHGCSVALWWSDRPVVDLRAEPWQGIRITLGNDWERIVRSFAAS